MDYSKLDAALSSALAEDSASAADYGVFIRTTGPVGDAEVAELRAAGATEAGTSSETFTGKLSSEAIDDLSQKVWVRSIRLTRTLTLAEPH